MTAIVALTFIPETATDPVRFLLLGALSAAIVGAGKAGFGGGIGMISTPLMIYACGNAMTAAAVMLPLLIATDYVTLIPWWGKWDVRAVLPLLPGMLLGVGAGWILLRWFQSLGDGGVHAEATNAGMTLAIGVVAVSFVILHVTRTLLGRRIAFRPTNLHAVGFGAAAGLTSTVAHAAGPITQMYLLPQNMPKGRFVASCVLYYWVGNQVKLIPYFALSMVSAATLGADLALLPAIVGGAAIGLFLHNRVNQKWFSRIVYGLLLLIGLHLTVTSAAKLQAGL